MKNRIKELEYQLSDKGRKNSELFATNAELRNRIKVLEVINKDLINDRDKTYNIYETHIKELEVKIAHSNDNVDTMLDIADKAHTECNNLEYEKGVSNRHIKYLNNRIKELEEKNRTLYDANKLMFEQVKSIADKDKRIEELEEQLEEYVARYPDKI